MALSDHDAVGVDVLVPVSRNGSRIYNETSAPRGLKEVCVMTGQAQ